MKEAPQFSIFGFMTTSTHSRKRTGVRVILVSLCVVLLFAVSWQWSVISGLREENESLRSKSQTMEPAGSAGGGVSQLGEQVQVENDRLELLRLRNETRELREQVAQLTAARSNSASPAQNHAPESRTANAVAAQAQNDEIRQLGLAAMRGKAGALDKLAKIVSDSRALDTNAQAGVRSDLRDVFQSLGAEAGKGNSTALQAMWQASRIKELQGFAVEALGQAAGQGNDEALKPLLDPESYMILRSSAVAALKPAADAGNVRAIEALAATAANQSQSTLWMLAAQGLATAASGGNPTAIDSLAALAATDNQNVRQEALQALEAAARKNQPRAEEALKKLGWR
jgi:hypothetical protein